MNWLQGTAISALCVALATSAFAAPIATKQGGECFVKSDYMEIGVHSVSNC